MDGSPLFEAMVQREFARLLLRAPGCSRNTRIDYALAALRMTHEEAHALAVERVAADGAQAYFASGEATASDSATRDDPDIAQVCSRD